VRRPEVREAIFEIAALPRDCAKVDLLDETGYLIEAESASSRPV
jgi:hypothetical protein